MIQQCPGAKEANWILGCIGKRLREVILPLSFALLGHSGVLCAVLGSSAQERSAPVEGYEDNDRTGASVL